MMEEAMIMFPISALPEDIILQVFGQVHFGSLIHLMSTSKGIHDLIKRQKHSICKSIYLAHMDAPPHDLDWFQEVKHLALLWTRCVANKSQGISANDMACIGKTMLRVAKNASPAPGISAFSSSPVHLPSRNVLFLSRLFDDADLRDRFLYVSGVFTQPPEAQAPSQTFWDPDPAVSKLHCLYGRVHSMQLDPDSCQRGAHVRAAAKVYNIAEYIRHGNWGPFRDAREEEVDWTRVEASMMVLAHNTTLRKLDKLNCMTKMPPFSGSYPGSFSSLPRLAPQLAFDRDEDPYGITGTWVKVDSAMSGRIFRLYNSLAWAMPFNVIQRYLMSQATDCVAMVLWAADTESVAGSDGLPIESFEGFSWSLTSPSTDRLFDITGTCHTTAEGEVRWKVLYSHDGMPKWRAEAVQIGGVKSGRGAIGTWFPANYVANVGVGPVAFWKLSNKCVEQLKLISLHDPSGS